MKHILLYIMMAFAITMAKANNYPEFKNQPVSIKIPESMIGVRSDKGVNGTITYNVNGYLFNQDDNRTIQERATGYDGTTEKATPYQTLTELVDAVRRKSWKDLISLYTDDSRKLAEQIVPADKRDDYFNALNATKEVKVLLGMEFQDMYVVMVQTSDNAVNPVFFQKKKNKYLLAAVKDSSAMLWNVGLYLRYKPGPLLPVQLSAPVADSIKYGDEQKMSFKVSKPGNRVILFKDEVNTLVTKIVEDNGAGDFDPAQGIVEIHLNSSYLPSRKQYEILAMESNYPATKVTADMPAKATRIRFKVY